MEEGDWLPASALPLAEVLAHAGGYSVSQLVGYDYRLIREMLARWTRGELSRDRAEDLSYKLAHGVASRMGQDFRQWQSRGWEPITFLQSVLNAREARE